MSKDEAKVVLNRIHFYADGGYVDIRNGNDKKGRTVLEDFIDKSPKWDNSSPLYRGINVGFDFFKKLKVGAKVNMKGISSWSSEINTAKDFAKFAGKKAQIVFRLPTTDLAVPIAHLSEGGKQWSAKEILLSGKSQLSIKTWEQKGKVVYIDVDEMKQKQFALVDKGIISNEEKLGKAISIIERWSMDSDIVEIEI